MKTNTFAEMYGLAPMTLEEEMNASSIVHAKRNAKISIVTYIHFIRMILDSLEETAKGIPETEDIEHLEIVLNYQEKIKELHTLASEINNSRYA